jgi:hypothetical protein
MKVTYIGNAWKKSLLLGLLFRLYAARFLLARDWEKMSSIWAEQQLYTFMSDRTERKRQMQSPNSEWESIMPWDVESSFKTGLQISSRDQSVRLPSFDKNWFPRFKSEINSF